MGKLTRACEGLYFADEAFASTAMSHTRPHRKGWGTSLSVMWPSITRTVSAYTDGCGVVELDPVEL
jgi:hypothetical protein